ncbi:MAG: hypothetical protein OXQ86_01895 [Gammaproteobacteria bacterium]|nr:hypothetical protein [Gammaproteobacteria bacterium]MDE0414696.1 hypothetical protein [Gammaproteobacteria bacterium]
MKKLFAFFAAVTAMLGCSTMELPASSADTGLSPIELESFIWAIEPCERAKLTAARSTEIDSDTKMKLLLLDNTDGYLGSNLFLNDDTLSRTLNLAELQRGMSYDERREIQATALKLCLETISW